MKLNLFSLRRNILILVIILFLGLLLRVILIDSSPSSLYGDELTITLDAYSLLKTGHDQLGNFLPLTFPMGAGRPAGYVYGSIPFIAIFGPTALGVRSLSVLSGMGIILLLFIIGRKLFSEKIGLIAAAIGVLSPWDISLSRGGFEAHFALLLVLLGFYLFLLAKEKPLLYIFSASSFGLTFHTYPTYKVSLLLFLPLLVWYWLGVKNVLAINKKYFFGGVLILIVLGVLSLSQTFLAGSEARFSDINIFSKLKDSIEQKINYERQITKLPQSLSKYFYNKPVEISKVFIENYLQHFSMDFLVLHGDRNPRHNMATMGELYAVEIVLIVIGLLNFWQKERRTISFLLFWIFIAPIPTALIDLPHVLRSSFMLPPLLLLSALGLSVILTNKNKTLLFIISLIFIIQFIFFIQKLYFLAPMEYNNFWSYSARIASEITKQNINNFKYILLSDEIIDIEFAYPVYAKVDPSVVISQNNKKTILSNLSFKRFGNVYIGYISNKEIQNFIQNLDGSVLYITTLDGLKYLKNPEKIVSKDGVVTLVLSRIYK